jgi:MFS family permease
MQAAFLISAKGFTEHQIGVLFFVFGFSQFLCMAPSGYFLDYSNNKINWVMFSGFAASTLTVLTALTAAPNGENMGLMIVLKVLQGGIIAILPPGFNGITLGIVGSTGFTHQVSRNRMMNHMGTALVVAIGTLISYFLYPNIGHLFIVSPLAAIGFYYNLSKIKPHHVNKDAARGLIIMSPTMTEYEYMDEENELMDAATEDEGDDEKGDIVGELPFHEGSYVPPDLLSPGIRRSRTQSGDMRKQHPRVKVDVTHQHEQQVQPAATDSSSKGSNNNRSFGSLPSFNFGWGVKETESQGSMHSSIPSPTPLRAQTPLSVILDPTLMVFALVVFFFHLANSAVLPLVMQSLKVKDTQAGILLSGMCIVVAQAFMAYFAKIVGDYSPYWGRKNLSLVAFLSLTLRCLLLTVLVTAQNQVKTWRGVVMFKFLILSTQLLDSVGAGIFGTMQIVVTNDISAGTGRFSLMMGITTGAMCLGGTISGYVGHAIAQDFGYASAFSTLGVMSLIPIFLYLFFVPETLPEYAKPKKRRRRLEALLQRLNAQRQSLKNPFQIRRNPDDAYKPGEHKTHSQHMERRSPEMELV